MVIVFSCFQINKKSKEENNLEQTISVLRKAGFFEKYTDKTDKEVIKILHKKRINDYTQLYKSYYDPGMSLSAIELASLDEDKMLYLDLEADVCNENKIYCEVIKMFDKLGKEDFNPTQISEFWESETGPIHVSFVQGSDTTKIDPTYLDDWLHESVFIECQKQIEKKGKYRLVYSLGVDGYGYGQSVVLMRLTIKEQNVLERAFDWKFVRE